MAFSKDTIPDNGANVIKKYHITQILQIFSYTLFLYPSLHIKINEIYPYTEKEEQYCDGYDNCQDDVAKQTGFTETGELPETDEDHQVCKEAEKTTIQKITCYGIDTIAIRGIGKCHDKL